MSHLTRGFATTAVCAMTAALLIVAPTSALAAEDEIVINEIVYDDISGVENDTIELYNAGGAPVDVSGWSVTDEKNEESGVIGPGVNLDPGDFLVLEKDIDFPFGLGKGDEVVLSDAAGAIIDFYAYENTSPIATFARCPDGTGEWAHATTATPGAANDCTMPTVPGSVVLNEVDSGPADWVELYNPGTEAFELSGYELRDNSDDHRWAFPADTTIAAGEFLLVEADSIGVVDGEPARFDAPIGIGSTDEMRLFDPSGALIDRTGAWEGHASIDGDEIAATLARCPDGVGSFALAYATPGAANDCVPPTVAINEIDSNGSPDWAEIVNTGTAPIDISGWTLMDDDPVGHAADVTVLAEGTILDPGGYFVFDGASHFRFGLGNGDTVTIRNTDGLAVAEHTYAAHAEGFWARCEDGTGDFIDVAVGTPGIRNACGIPVRINEVESDGDPDWVELVNPTGAELDVSGIVLKDDDDSHEYRIPASTSIPAGGYLVLEELDFGIGKDDTVRLFDGEQLVDSTSWGASHAAPTWGRCPDVTGPFAVTAEATKGAANICEGEIAVSPWPGSDAAEVLDSTPMFLEDSSGLDVHESADGTWLWAVDNGEGRIWKLSIAADRSVSFAVGWTDGKRVRFQRDAANPGAAGPDTEGITVDDDGLVYVASERDNSAKGVNQNTILQVDPDEQTADLIALTEWDLTELLPAVGANLGIEAVEWVSDAALTGKLFDDNRQAAYDPSQYAGKSDGLFFVAVEDGGGVFAFALSADGSAELISTIDPGLAGVMALDHDTVLDVLWAVCDDGCGGKSAQITLNGTDTPGIAHFARAAGLPDINNEGFATAPASLSVGGQRPIWWFADGFASEALRVGALPGIVGDGPGGGEVPGDGGSGGAGGPGAGGDAGSGENEGSSRGDGALAATGAETPAAAIALALMMLLVGGLALTRRRRRQAL